MKAAQMRGDLVSIEAMGREIDRAVAAVRARALAVPNKLAPVLRPDDPNVARRLLEAAMLELLDELREITLADEQDPEGDPEPMPEAA